MICYSDAEPSFGIFWDSWEVKVSSIFVLSICVVLVLCTSKDQDVELFGRHGMIYLRKFVGWECEWIELSNMKGEGGGYGDQF